MKTPAPRTKGQAVGYAVELRKLKAHRSTVAVLHPDTAQLFAGNYHGEPVHLHGYLVPIPLDIFHTMYLERVDARIAEMEAELTRFAPPEPPNPKPPVKVEEIEL